MTPQCSIFFHNYYGAHKYWRDFFFTNLTIDYNLYYNSVEDSIYNIGESEKNETDSILQFNSTSKLNRIIYRKSSNKGKDIGGKLVLLDAYLKLDFDTEYGLFVHDKKSPFKANNTAWADELLKVASPGFIARALDIFSKQADVGIITANGNLINEYSESDKCFSSNNKLLLPVLQRGYNIFPATFQYVAGTMYWFRMKPVADFFRQYSPLSIRALLENGNITDDHEGSYTHSWERLLSWLITSSGFKIKTI